MRTKRSLLPATTAILGLAILFAATTRLSRAQQDEEKARDNILKVADSLSKSNASAAKQQADALKGADLDDIMPLFSKRSARNKKALGIGPTPGAIQPDGIEAKIEQLGRKQLSPSEVAAQAAAIEQAAYVAAAIAMVVHDKCPVENKQGNKDPKDWVTWSEDMGKASMELAAVAKARNAAGIQKAADRLDGVCKSCHVPFK
jgi:hypothetical protein